jgi:hypothetical protein
LAAGAAVDRAAVGGAPARTALVVGACGATGEWLLNHLLGHAAYARVIALTRLPLPSTTRKLETHLHRAPDLGALAGLPAADAAFLVIGEHHSFYRRDEAFHALPFDALVHAARAVRESGTPRLAVVAPVAIYTHSSAFRSALMNRTEYELFALHFEQLVLVRPAAPERFARHRHWGRRLGAFLLRQVHGLMPEAYHPPTSREIALAAAHALDNLSSGLIIVDADQVRAASGPPS